MATAAAAGAAGAGGFQGNAADAPGHLRAAANCFALVDRQVADDVVGREGQFDGGALAPANCDHAYNPAH